jgi:glycosyltransferase involved in cell wall biosynthesis
MKVIAILETSIGAGGAFNQSLNAILQMRDICSDKFDFQVFSTSSEEMSYLQNLGINSTFFKYKIVDRLLALCYRIPILCQLLMRLEIIGPFESKLINNGADIVYFLTDSSRSELLVKLNYITTILDLAHRDTPEFPEVRNYKQIELREWHFNHNLAAATLIITASDSLSKQVFDRYGVDPERVLSMPFAPSPFLDKEVALPCEEILKIYNLQKGYFFYPAQFWAHKNHIRILEALVLVRDQGFCPNVVFSGGDKGNRAYLEKIVTAYSLEDQVRFLGFVPPEHMLGLYEGCLAVTMPTYFGPTNLPPLEAWMIGKPLIYSSNLLEEVGDAAICVDPDNAEQLAEAIIECHNQDRQENLVKRGKMRLSELYQRRSHSEDKLREHLIKYTKRRQCWG